MIKEELSRLQNCYKKNSILLESHREIEPDSLFSLCLSLHKSMLDERKILTKIENQIPDGCYIPAMPDMALGKMEKWKSGYRFILDGLLPHRPSYNTETRRYDSAYDRNLFYAGYHKIVQNYISGHGELLLFKEKVLIHVVNYFAPGDQWVDNDNVDTKTFIDACVNHVLIMDDSPKYSSLLIEGEEGTYTHSEIFVVPVRRG